MHVQRLRMEVAAQNLANADATRTPEGGPYRRKEVVVAAVGPHGGDFVPLLVRLLRGEAAAGEEGLPQARVVGLIDDSSPLKRVYDPGHPDADANGYVLLPNVDVPMEMADLMTAARTYEANATALETMRRSLERALELLK